MRFVVKATKRDWIGAPCWIGSVGRNGLLAVGTRQQAQVFASRDEADRAIDTLSRHFAASGVRFSIEPVELDSPAEAASTGRLGTDLPPLTESGCRVINCGILDQ